MRESLKKQPHPVVCEKIFAPAITDDRKRSFANMVRLNLAHVLMLHKQKILRNDQTERLCRCLLQLSESDGSAIGSDPLLEDYYFNFERYVIDRCGMDSGGALHTARSRNDLNSTIIRMNVREELLFVQEKLIGFIRSILDLAEKNTETVMTGYTHLQPAQPITLAHYLTGVSQGLLRDVARLEHANDALNQLPLGACAFAGTSFPIDRQYTAGLLGFDGVLCNTIDSIASRDYLLEITADLAILGTTVSRFASDLYIWATDEFGYLSIDDSLACCSSIMPQKRNPLALEHAKAKAAHLIGIFTDLAAVLRGTPYGHCRDLGEMLSPFWQGMQETITILELMTAVDETMSLHGQQMETRTEKNYCTVTELADMLVIRDGLPFREAHRIVGNLVRNSVAAGLDASQITVEQLDEECRAVAGRNSGLNDAQLRQILSGKNSVAGKLSQGAPSPENCRKMIVELGSALEKADRQRLARQEKLSKSYSRLFQLSQELT